jgi:cation diffusion facilitator CzcD-associated flavoprotein CzcO
MTAVDQESAVTTAPEDMVSGWLAAFNSALAARDAEAIASLFVGDGYWRDLGCCTWDVRTFAGQSAIAEALRDAADTTGPHNFAIEPAQPVTTVTRPRFGVALEAIVTFRMSAASGRGYHRLRNDPDSGDVRAWTLLTTIGALDGHPEQVGPCRPEGMLARGPGEEIWLEAQARESAFLEESPQVVILGAGHSGLAIAARLKALGLTTLIVERNERVGDNWRNRYRSLNLHNEVWANHLPYMPFPATWPVFCSKDKLGDWLEAYAQALDLNVWTSTSLTSAAYSDRDRQWTIVVDRPDGTTRTLRPHHFVLATGVSGEARGLEIAGAEDFDGEILQARDYQQENAAPGRKVLVIGTGSSAHDIAQDYCHAGAEVTLLQRSSTCVISIKPGASLVYGLYREDGPATEDCDLVVAASPIPLLAELHKDLTKQIAELDAEMLDGLEKAGFRTDLGPDGSGYLMKYYLQGGGYYINVGCSELIISGRIKVKQGVSLERLTNTDAVFSDGTRIPTDLVVLAIGFENMQESIRSLMGDLVAERVGPVWGLDAAGELCAMWRPTGQTGLWVMGGSLVQCRQMSKVLAFQIAAAEYGLSGSRRLERLDETAA